MQLKGFIKGIGTAVLLLIGIGGAYAYATTNITGPLSVFPYTSTACSTSTEEGDICASEDILAGDDLTVTGLATIGETLTVSGVTAFTGGTSTAAVTITGADALVAADCGKLVTVTAGIDAASLTLPATINGCEFTIMYIGADGGALLDISPAAADGIHGTCTLAASALEFSGTDDADIGLTKTTANTGDTITLYGDGVAGWYVTACAGIWANN